MTLTRARAGIKYLKPQMPRADETYHGKRVFNDSGLAEIVDAIEKKTADNIMFSAALEGMDDTESAS